MIDLGSSHSSIHALSFDDLWGRMRISKDISQGDEIIHHEFCFVLLQAIVFGLGVE